MAEGCRRRPRGWLVCAVLLGTVACTDDPVAPADGAPMIDLAFHGLPPLDAASEGVYEVWLVDADARIVSAGRIADPRAPMTVRSELDAPAHVMVTVEPPGDADAAPSLSRILGGRFAADGTAELGVTGYLTLVGIPLETAPGVHMLATTSAGAPDDAGLWLVDARVDSTDAGYFQTFTPLTRGWAYEGWIVRDRGSAEEVWLSYGQFVPNNIRKARFRDDTGIGPLSGHVDYERALGATIHYPGDDWVANPHGVPVPGGLELPLDLNGDAAAGVSSRWTHVITIEPVVEPDGIRLEAPWEARPFFLRPYDNPIGEAAAAEPRTIGYDGESLPRGTARIRGTAG